MEHQAVCDDSGCRSVMCNQEREASLPLVHSLLQREVLGPFTDLKMQTLFFKKDQNNHHRLEWEEQS